jgi:hypothetical protein
MVDGGTMMVTSDTCTVDGGTLVVAGGTQMFDGSTLTVDGGTKTSDDHHRLDSVIASTSQSRHHEAKQHPHVC